MASTFSTNLALELIGTGDQAGTWGITTNTNLGTLIEQAISGYVTQAVATGTDTTITIPDGATGVARNMYIELTGTGGASTNLIVPANKKLYFIFNNSTGAVTVKVSGQTGVSVPQGKKMVLVSNGTDIVNAANYVADFGSNSATITQLTSTSATITNLTCTSLTLSNNPTLSGGTANGVLYLNGSKVATSGSALTFDGTSLNAGSAVFPSGRIRLKQPDDTTKQKGLIIEAAADDSILAVGYDGTCFTYNATYNSTGGYKPQAWWVSGSESMRLTSTGLGIGTSSPAYKLDVNGNAQVGNATAATNRTLFINGVASKASRIAFQESGVDRWLIGNGAASENGNFEIYDATNGNNFVLTRSGNLGLGVTPSAWSLGKAIEVGNPGNSIFGVAASQLTITQNAYYNAAYKYGSSAAASRYDQAAGQHIWFTAPSGTAGNAITFTQAMTLDASSNLMVGGTTVRGKVTFEYSQNSNADVWLRNNDSGSSSACGYIVNAAGNSWRMGMGSTANNSNALTWVLDVSSPSEKMRLATDGTLIVGKTSTTLTTSGTSIEGSGVTGIAVGAVTSALYINRQSDDGTLIQFRQANTEEGSISVSGNTVSYNAFAGSHWSQLQDGSKPDILRGTVMESINELCVWPGEQNERLPKSKVSDTAGSKKVYGVFMAWDNYWTETNDMYVTAVGAFICRVNGSVTVQEGDLLESNGDGTARVQADDIIRSSTIGKVTSTVKTHQYDDGSYCVPTVLYCG